MKRVISIALFSLLALHVIGQPAWKSLSTEELETVFDEISAAYRSHSYRFDILHQSFKGHDSQRPYDEMAGFYAKSGNRYHWDMLGSEVLQDEQHMIIMQHRYQELQLHNARDHFAEQITAITSDDQGRYEEIAYRQEKHYREYRITYEKMGRVEQMTFRLLPNGFLQEMVLYLSALDGTSATEESLKPKIRIAFENLESDYAADKEEYDTELYLHIDKKSVEAGDKTAGYDIKDMRLSVK